jgi:hypothetical protein
MPGQLERKPLTPFTGLDTEFEPGRECVANLEVAIVTPKIECAKLQTSSRIAPIRRRIA